MSARPIFFYVTTIVSADGDFEWLDSKAASNIAAHGVTFEQGAYALATDPNEFAEPSPNAPGRVQSLVLSKNGDVLFVVSRHTGLRTHIISARKADADEQRTYFQGG